MGLFDRIFGLFGGSASARPAAVPPPAAKDRVSPQGWTDDVDGWPRAGDGGASAFALGFATPWDAVDGLEATFSALHRLHKSLFEGGGGEAAAVALRRAIEAYAHNLQALYILDREMGKRKGTYGRLAHVIVEHLDKVPFLLGHPLIAMKLRYLGEDLGDSGAPELGPEGRQVDEAVRRAQEVMAKGQQARTEGEEARPAAAKGGDELTPTRVMEVLLEECFKDGKISEEEERIFLELRALMRLPRERFAAMMTAAAKAGGGGQGELDAAAFFERLYREAMADGELTATEDELLSAVASYLAVAPSEVEAIRARVAEGAVVAVPQLARLEDEEARFEGDDVEAAVHYAENGDLLVRFGNLDRAAARYERALGIFREQGRDHEDFPLTLNSLGMAQRQLGRFEEAATTYQEALDVLAASVGPEHPNVAAVQNNLGVVYRNLGRHADAMDLYTQAEKVRAATLGTDHPDYASTLNNLGALSHEMGEYRQAIGFFERARGVYREALGGGHPKTGGVVANIANAWAELGESAKAKEAYRESLAILTRALPDVHPLLAAPLTGYASILEAEGDAAGAQAFRARAILCQMRS